MKNYWGNRSEITDISQEQGERTEKSGIFVEAKDIKADPKLRVIIFGMYKID